MFNRGVGDVSRKGWRNNRGGFVTLKETMA